MISAKIICDSKNEHGNRLTTFVLTFPRIVLSEFNTHRAISRNSASSRAIPFKKMLELVKTNPFIPLRWMKEHTGMQGSEYFSGIDETTMKSAWLNARDKAVTQAEFMSNWGLTKQLCNRLLEPFMYHTVIATGTEWSNFFALRADEPAEIHIQDLAYKMLDAYNESTPKELKSGEWHIPFGDTFDHDKLIERSFKLLSANTGWTKPPTNEEMFQHCQEMMIRIATARCARISYNNFEGKDDYDEDFKLYSRLKQGGHMSPFEHCAQALSYSDKHEVEVLTGNFQGFIQHRKMIVGENKIDPRILIK